MWRIVLCVLWSEQKILTGLTGKNFSNLNEDFSEKSHKICVKSNKKIKTLNTKNTDDIPFYFKC